MKLAFALALALSTSALAEEPRKINFTEALTDMDGVVMTECADKPVPKTEAECKAQQPVTLGVVALRALVQPEQNVSPDDGLKRGQLALAVYKAEDAKLTAEEISLIKKQMAKIYSPLVIVRAFTMLDPASAK